MNRIHAKGSYEYFEYAAGVAGIRPGMLIAIDAIGEVVKNGNPAGDIGDELLIALESPLEGKSVDDIYNVGDIVGVMRPHKGSTFYGLLQANDTVSFYEKLMSNGNGHFSKQVTPKKIPVVTMEDPAVSTEHKLILMRAT